MEDTLGRISREMTGEMKEGIHWISWQIGKTRVNAGLREFEKTFQRISRALPRWIRLQSTLFISRALSVCLTGDRVRESKRVSLSIYCRRISSLFALYNFVCQMRDRGKVGVSHYSIPTFAAGRRLWEGQRAHISEKIELSHLIKSSLYAPVDISRCWRTQITSNSRHNENNAKGCSTKIGMWISKRLLFLTRVPSKIECSLNYIEYEVNGTQRNSFKHYAELENFPLELNVNKKTKWN